MATPPTLLGIDPPQKNASIECPFCGQRGIIDWEQLHGEVSIRCDCGYHDTHDLTDQIPDR